MNRPAITMFTMQASPVRSARTWQGANAADWPCDVSLLSIKAASKSSAAAAAQAWLFRSSYSSSFVPPAGCKTIKDGTTDGFTIQVGSLFSACPNIIPLTLGDEPTGKTSGGVTFERAPDLVTFELICGN